MIVVLRTPSLAERVARAPHAAKSQERSWTSADFAAQHAVLATLAAHGLTVEPDYSFGRVLDGFSAPLVPRAVARLDADPRVLGIYPVRAAFPATVRFSNSSSVAQPDRKPDLRGLAIRLTLPDGADLPGFATTVSWP